HFLFLAIVGDDRSAIDNKTIGRHCKIALEPTLDGSDSSNNRESVDSGLDVSGGSTLLSQFLCHNGNLITGLHDERDHRCAITPGQFESLNELLDLPD
ncbi:hypothetical protein PENTCL1PPCAC_1805, partial [Pristionchus entomophagus]